jgi:endonuclease I
MLLSLTAWAGIPNGYYTNAIGLQDEALMTALEGIIYTHTQLDYNYLWKAFNYTDKGDDGYYIDMYSTCKYDYYSTHVGNATYVGQGINREHSFPKSWFGGEEYPMYTDLTMLIPTDAYVNQRRSNYPYGVCAGGYTYVNDSLGVSMKGKLGNSTYNGYSDRVFEPDDEYKGDFARIYFYMVTCYKSDIANWPGCDQLDYLDNNYKAFSDWSMQLLMEWHRADPVSTKEINRNEAVYGRQGNRNPFVDHPELAEHIWGTKQHKAWTGQDIPDDPFDKDTPVMLPVDESSVNPGSFRADWTSVENVSSYTLSVNRIASGDEQEPTLLMTETFNDIVTDEDGTKDISSSLNQYTDNLGWTGYKVYLAANHGVKLGTSNAAGYLVSPALELDSTVSVVVNAKSWINSHNVSDGSSMVVSCGDVSQTVELSTAPEDYTIVLKNCTGGNIKLSMTEGGKRFYIYDVKVYNGNLNTWNPRRAIEEEGDTTWRKVSGIVDTCYTVKNLAGGVFEYLVKAVFTDGTESDWSNIQRVTLTGDTSTVLIGDVNGDGLVNISDVIKLINFILTNDTTGMVPENSDLNGDEQINITDATLLINEIAYGQ